MSALLGLAAIVLGLVCVLADERIARVVPDRPDSGAALSRAIGLVLLVGGGLAFLQWAQ